MIKNTTCKVTVLSDKEGYEVEKPREQKEQDFLKEVKEPFFRVIFDFIMVHERGCIEKKSRCYFKKNGEWRVV